MGRVAAARSILPPAAPLPQSIPDAPATHTPPLPDAPSADSNTLTPPLGDVPQLPAVPPPLPDLPWPASPLTLDPAREPPPPDPTGAAALPDASYSVLSPYLAPAAALTVPGEQSTLVPATAAGVLPLFDDASTPARAPPAQLPLHPCPHGDTTHPNFGDSAVARSLYGNDAPLRVRLPADARAYASSSVLDRLLRPD